MEISEIRERIDNIFNDPVYGNRKDWVVENLRLLIAQVRGNPDSSWCPQCHEKAVYVESDVENFYHTCQNCNWSCTKKREL